MFVYIYVVSKARASGIRLRWSYCADFDGTFGDTNMQKETAAFAVAQMIWIRVYTIHSLNKFQLIVINICAPIAFFIPNVSPTVYQHSLFNIAIQLVPNVWNM